ncbi:unnamed protein product, partial [Mesorhabditis belari]|uniref:Hexosyltransferase n=1 Tax=Mesorhabditis belari TaxID=2138241 RepID=A0AAF3F644_9BILA
TLCNESGKTSFLKLWFTSQSFSRNFHPNLWSENDKLLADAFHYGRRRGYFRHFGFGLAALYKADLDRAGGFNTGIDGWGLEDVDFFERNLRTQKSSHHSSARAWTCQRIHIYHPIVCDPSLPRATEEHVSWE